MDRDRLSGLRRPIEMGGDAQIPEPRDVPPRCEGEHRCPARSGKGVLRLRLPMRLGAELARPQGLQGNEELGQA